MARILVADDESEVRMAIINILQEGGHETFEAFDGLSALDGVIEHGPDVLLCDWMMPELFGGEVIEKLRKDAEFEAFKDLPVIVVSDFADETSEKKFKQAGANGFVAKNDNIDVFKKDILQCVSQVLEDGAEDVEPL